METKDLVSVIVVAALFLMLVYSETSKAQAVIDAVDECRAYYSVYTPKGLVRQDGFVFEPTINATEGTP